MQLISFYSFKGGVGRTNALLNAAWILASRKYFVAVVDMDLHAPGLTLMPDMAPPADWPGPKLGLIDFLADVFNPEMDSTLDLKALTYRPRLVPEQSTKNFQGDLLFLPCAHMGSQEADENYRDQLRQLPLNTLNDLRASGRNLLLIQEIREQLSDLKSDRLIDRKLDFLFLDARTGFTEIGDMIIGDASDHVVALLSLNEQNRRGLEFLLTEILNETDFPINQLPNRMSILVGPVPDGEEALKQAAMGRIEATLQRFARTDSSTNTPEVMPDILTIPYHPILALTEQIIARDYPNSRPAQAYQRFTELLVKRVESTEAATLLITAEAKAQIATLLPKEEKQPFMKLDASVDVKFHPFGHILPWNLLSPDKSWSDLLPGFVKSDDLDPDMFLSLLASSLQSIDDKKKMLRFLPDFNVDHVNRLIGVLQKEREHLLKLPIEHWNHLAGQLGESWERWLGLLQEYHIKADYSLLGNQLVRDRMQALVRHSWFWHSWGWALDNQCNWLDGCKLFEISVQLFGDGRSRVLLGRVYASLERFDDGVQSFQTVLKQCEQEKDKFWQVAAKLELGNLYIEIDRLQEAEFSFLSAQSAEIGVDSQDLRCNINWRFGELYVLMGRMQEAESFYQNALSLANKAENPILLSISNRFLAHLYLRTERLDQAEFYIAEAMNLQIKDDWIWFEYQLKRLHGEILTHKKEFVTSRQLLDEAELFFRKLAGKLGLVQLLISQARLFFAEGNWDAARAKFLEAKTLATDRGLVLRARLVDEEMGQKFAV